MSQAVSPPIIRSSRTVHWASGICQARLLLPLTWVSCSNSTTLAVTASKFDIYQMLFVQFLSSWWWAEKPPETCTALTVIKNIVYRCILLVILKRIHCWQHYKTHRCCLPAFAILVFCLNRQEEHWWNIKIFKFHLVVYSGKVWELLL